jgi:hypothetical protein
MTEAEDFHRGGGDIGARMCAFFGAHNQRKNSALLPDINVENPFGYLGIGINVDDVPNISKQVEVQ